MIRGLFASEVLINEKIWYAIHLTRNPAMKTHQLSAVVFDCDGVLLESNAAKTLAFGRTVEAFGQEAMDKMTAYHKAHGGVSRVKKFQWFYRNIARQPLPDPLLDTLCQRFSDLCRSAVLSAPMVPGAQKSLEFLKGRVPLFVASGTPEKELEDILYQRGLSHYFEGVHGTPPEKEFLLERIIRTGGFNPSAVVMVGDASTDLKAARYCRTLFYGRGDAFSPENVPWGEDLTGLVDYLSKGFDFV